MPKKNLDAEVYLFVLIILSPGGAGFEPVTFSGCAGMKAEPDYPSHHLCNTIYSFKIGSRGRI